MEPSEIHFPDILRAFPRLERYLAKHQEAKDGFRDALRQIHQGKSHWICWILPQIFGEVSHHEKGSDGSTTSQEFALESLYEAIAFLCHPELGKHYFACIQAIRIQVEPRGRNGGQGRTLNEIFGETDAKKVRCSVTLFRRLAGWCYALSPASYATLIANCDAILVAASRDGHRSCDHVSKLYRQLEESLEDPQNRAKMQEMFPVECIHCGDSVWPPDHNWRFVHNWCVEENALTWTWPGAAEPYRLLRTIWNYHPLENTLSSGGHIRERDAHARQAGAAISDSLRFTANDVEPLAETLRNRLYVGPPNARHESQKGRQDWLQNLAPEDDVPLEDLGLDPALASFLKRNDIRGVAQLVSLTEEELMAIRHLGSGKAAKIRAGLERFGWRLGEVSSFPTGRSELRSALADQAQRVEYKQREANGLVWPLVSDGSSIHRIVESTGLSEAVVREARNAWMVEQRIAGASNRAIGKTVGMSAEAVRRSIKRVGKLDSGHIRELRAERLKGSIRETVTSMPGSSLDEIAEKAGVSRIDVRRNLDRLGTKLVWGQGTSPKVKNWSDEQLLQALQVASTRSTPLTVAAYDELVTLEQVKGPTGQVFYLRFGSWKEACEAAGVQCGESARDNYTRKWSEIELREFVVKFLFSPEHDGSLVEFQQWLKKRPEAPSVATIRNHLGHWDSMKKKAIEEIVASGRLDELCALCDAGEERTLAAEEAQR